MKLKNEKGFKIILRYGCGCILIISKEHFQVYSLGKQRLDAFEAEK